MNSSDDDQDFPDDTDGDFADNCVTLDLFSDATFATPSECLLDAKRRHGVDFGAIVRENRMDCFSFFKLVNFIRSTRPKPSEVEKVMRDGLWNDEKYLRPVVEDDPLLQLGMDIDDGCFLIENLNLKGEPSSSKTTEDQDGDDMPALENNDRSDCRNSKGSDESGWDEMRTTIEKLRAEILVRDERMEQMVEDMNRMRVTAKALVGVGDEDSSNPESNKVAMVSESRSEAEDCHYAGSYAHFGIHHEMLSDRVRTESYRDALQHATGPVRGKSVLDLGCGTGILSMFCAAQAGGASAVTGVDMSDIIHQAMDIVRENSLETTITLLKGRLEDISELNGLKFDVIISEWMGYFLLFEGMLDSVITARKKHLKEGGRVLPNRCTMHLVAVSDPKKYADTVDYWKDVYGFKMSCMKLPSIVEASVEIVPAAAVVSTSPALIHDLDMEKCEVEDTQFESDFELQIRETCEVTAIAGYFDTFFDLADEKRVGFTTGPHGKYTHWKQTVFYLDKKLSVEKDDILRGKIEVKRPREDVRSLRVKITLNGMAAAQEYTME